MEITPAPAPPPRDLTVMDRALAFRIEIHPKYQVRTGTPLVLQDNRWRPAKNGETPMLFALEPITGTDMKVSAAKAIVVETHVRNLQLGPVRLVDPESMTTLRFVNDPAGRYLAVSASQVIMG